MVRAFIAIPCPESVRNGITEIQNKIKDLGNLKPVEPENIHLTLKFLGEIDEGMVGKISEKLDSLSGTERFEISLKGLGVFPKPDYVRVIWIGIDKGADRIAELHNRIDSGLNPFGFQNDGNFNTHLTIARVKSIDNKALGDILSKNSATEFGSFIADRIELMKSELTPKGPRYSVLHSAYLR